jgi:hypothetical protein
LKPPSDLDIIPAGPEGPVNDLVGIIIFIPTFAAARFAGEKSLRNRG